jgi:hypothetical protein
MKNCFFVGQATAEQLALALSAPGAAGAVSGWHLPRHGAAHHEKDAGLAAATASRAHLCALTHIHFAKNHGLII